MLFVRLVELPRVPMLPPLNSCPSLDLLKACVIFNRRAFKSISLSSGGLCLRKAFLSLCSLAIVWNFSAILARDAAVVAEETGTRGLELLKGGEILGGGAMIFARSEGLFSPDVTGPRPRRPGLLICTGERGRRRGLGGFRSPDGEGVELVCPGPRPRKGS